ncbi:MAG: TetR/AcrR family transcriptional regulator [Sphingomonas sp.]|uniref:TetR/AcrR family transcriptional regulator n=1 Tax=Sphingomonas sp. TaxID=28214 RepID=UPI001ACAF533|nr:TetR/AcrR family transcriptional regulator [Sphingomonas sp.]MBN8814309.1 TetR/AcrR family transcriptional regulator [Sphingomonas sp.]
MLDQPLISPRATRTRSALVTAGFDLLATKPIDAIAIDELVAAAGVGKGSFFNHFADKQAFASALATEVRLELEQHVDRANNGLTDPVERIAGGLLTCANFAIEKPKRAAVLLRSVANVTDPKHPLNKGLADDFYEAVRLGLVRPEARESGVLYWLGLCQTVIAYLLEWTGDSSQAEARIADLLLFGLAGIGVDHRRAEELSTRPHNVVRAKQ